MRAGEELGRRASAPDAVSKMPSMACLADNDGLPDGVSGDATVGRKIHRLVTDLYPICRSITGDGLRTTLRKIGEQVPLEIHEVPTGTRVFDWTVPKEWNITDAYVKNSAGERVIDFRKSNLHVVGYSLPMHEWLSLTELREHLHASPEHPDWIPYRTSYYRDTWGFCLSHNDMLALKEDTYEVCIAATLRDGFLSYGECYLPGDTRDEVLISCHTCHPSLCNDNLSGIAIAVHLARALSTRRRRYSYRFVFAPATIGAITWLARNEGAVSRIKHGLVLACLGDPGQSTYKKSRRGNAQIDRVVAHVLRHSGSAYEIRDFTPFGYDDRQYCSPGFDLPVGSLMRTPNGCYPEYHTSADDLEFVRPEALADSYSKCMKVIGILEANTTYMNQSPKCEPQLGRRGIYDGVGPGGLLPVEELAILWVLNLSDGNHSLLDIAERADMDFDVVLRASDTLREHDLLVETGRRGGLEEVRHG